MAALFYWDGVAWLPIATGGGGGGGIGPPGPAGADGISITVSGPQPTAPPNPRKGDQWISNAAFRVAEDVTVVVPAPVKLVKVTLLPDPPQTVIVSYLP